MQEIFGVGDWVTWDEERHGGKVAWYVGNYGRRPFQIVETHDLPPNSALSTGHGQKVTFQLKDGSIVSNISGSWLKMDYRWRRS